MKILYLSAHLILERDEISLFHELGHSVFSSGAYTDPSNPGENSLRPAIPGMAADPAILDRYHKISNEHPGHDFKDHLTKEFVDQFDVIIVMHTPRWIINNWDVMKHKPVVWRTIGQSNRGTEKSLKKYRDQGMKIVRHSPREKLIPDYLGEDTMIRFYKDPVEFDGYVGNIPRIVNISQAMFGGDGVPSRGDHMSLPEFKAVTQGFDWKIFGPNNEKAGDHNGGRLSFDDLKSMLRFNRVFLSMGTRPASYTLGFIEAMLTGIPIVSIGPTLGNAVYHDQQTFEQHEIIGENGVAGFWSDSVAELRSYCQQLLDDQELAQEVGQKGRLRAIELFGKNGRSKEWEFFLNSL